MVFKKFYNIAETLEYFSKPEKLQLILFKVALHWWPLAIKNYHIFQKKLNNG